MRPDSKQLDLAFGEAHYKMFPELRYFVNGEAPIEDIEVYFRFQKGWPLVVTIILPILASYPLLYLFDTVLGFGRWSAVGLIVLVLLTTNVLLLSLVIPKIRQVRIRAALRARLAELGIHTCRNCAYDLRGTPQRCPECGTPA